MAQLIEFTMRHGRADQIKNNFSDGLNREYDNSAFLKSDGKLFQLQRSCPQSSWMFGGQSASSCQQNAVVSCVKLAIIGQVVRGMTGKDG